MYLSNFIGEASDVIEKAMSNPALHPKRKPTLDNALKAVVSEVEKTAITNIVAEIEPKLADMYDEYEIVNQMFEHLDAEAKSEWASGLDDEVEKIMQPYEEHLSADWLGRNTIDTNLQVEGAVQKLAQSAAKEIVKQLCAVSTDEFKQGITQKTPAQVLSNAGITSADVQIYLDQHLAAQSAEQEEAMAEALATDINDVLKKVRAHVGENFDTVAIFSEFELIVDDDELLANGAGSRLGLTPEEVQVITMLTLDHGEDTPNVLMSMLDDVKPGKAGKAAPKAPAAPKAEPAMSEGGVDVLRKLKDHSAAEGTAIANAIGVSRATFNNYLNDKTAFAPDIVQKEALRGFVLKDLNGLYEALCLIDGVGVDRVFE